MKNVKLATIMTDQATGKSSFMQMGKWETINFFGVVMRVIQLFEDSQLKQQKLNRRSLLNSKPEFKQYHFQ